LFETMNAMKTVCFDIELVTAKRKGMKEWKGT
jgi:hypothetical protein